jgi:YD repeat-containing protein
MLIKSKDESVLRWASMAALTATCTSSDCGSRLQVSYVTRLGKYNGSQFFDSQLTDTSQLSVNLATGNAVLIADDLGVQRTWNSQRTEIVGQIGRSWVWGAGRDTLAYVQAEDGAIRYYAPGRAMYMFTKNPDGSYSSPPGLTATATNHGGGNIDIFFARSKTTMTFAPSHGQLVSSKDRNGNTTHYAYSTTDARYDGYPFTTTITDPAGRRVTASNDGTFITSVTDAAARTTSYAYTATTGAVDLLAQVTDAAGGVTGYEHDGFGRIKRITTPEGRIVRLAYDSANRVTSLTRVTDPAGDGGAGSGPTTTFDYTPITADGTSLIPVRPTDRGTTVVTDPRGNATTYRHDFSARIERVTDALGRHRDADYGPDNNVTTAYDAMGTATSNGKPTTYSYDAIFNPIKTTAPTGASSSATYATAGPRTCPTPPPTSRATAPATPTTDPATSPRPRTPPAAPPVRRSATACTAIPASPPAAAAPARPDRSAPPPTAAATPPPTPTTARAT